MGRSGRCSRAGHGAAWQRNASGFTLVELAIAAGTVVLVIFGSIQMFTYCLWEGEQSGNLTAAVTEAYGKIEEIRSTEFQYIMTQYGPGTPGAQFTPAHVEGSGAVFLSAINPDLYRIEVVVCWRERGTEILGEDTNLNGVLDGGEDANGNGLMDSPAWVSALVARR